MDRVGRWLGSVCEGLDLSWVVLAVGWGDGGMGCPWPGRGLVWTGPVLGLKGLGLAFICARLCWHGMELIGP
jgi:hypothetical protein